MPTAFTETFAPSPVLDLPHKTWTRREWAILERSGLLDGQRFELIEGELIKKMPKNRRHVITLRRFVTWLTRVFGAEYVNPEASVDLAPADNPTNEPEPDAFVLKRPDTEFLSCNPQPADLHLVAEVSDTTIRFDLATKARLYARAGIAEYWVFDINRKRLIVHRHPEGDRYTSIVTYAEHEAVAPLAAPHEEFPVRAAFPW